jgi:S1-C subfamily serine protease
VLDGKQEIVALATAIEPKGLLLTKASELDGKQEVTLRLSGGRLYPAGSVLRIDQAHDLAVLKTTAQELVPIQWNTSAANQGRIFT